MQENTAAAPAPSTNIALLPPAERAVIVLDSSKAEAQLKELVAKSADITEVKDKDGREQAHRAAMNLRNARTAITNAGKVARDDANAFSKAVIAEEKRLIAISQAEEDRVFALRDRFDAEQSRLKAEAERKEAERKARIQGQITSIRNIPVALAGANAAAMAEEIADLEAFKAGEEFGEFTADADAAALTALATLRGMHQHQVAAEVEAKRLADERAALEAEKAAQAERDRVAAEERARAEAEAAAARKAEEDRLRAEREAFEAERRAFAEQQAAARTRRGGTQSCRAEGCRTGAEGWTGQPAVDRRAFAEQQAAARAEEERKAAEQKAAEPQTIGADLAAGPDTTEALVMINAEDGTSLGAVKVTDIAESDASEDEKQAAMAKRCLEIGVAELTTSTADDKDLVDGFTIMVAGLYETRSADAIRELLDSVLMELEGKKVAA